jgi:nitrite reductase/ring-hydroxylating ferredoxin subunit/Fe-S cluster biogenesis protein NfuA
MAEPHALPDDAAELLARQAGDLARLEAITAGWDAQQQGVVAALKTGIEQLNAEAFKRLIRTLKAEPAAAAALREAVRDPLVFQVLRFHGLVKDPVEHRVARALDEVRPFLASHGGDVELVAVKLPDTVEVRLVGSCQSCPSSGETLSEGVEKAIKSHCPEIVNVVRVSRGAAAEPGSAQVIHFVSPFARARDAGWADACALAELPDGAVVVKDVEGREVLLWRRGERVACYDNACAHMGMPLDGGTIEGGTLTCPYHGFSYLLDTGECLTVPEVQLATHAVKVAGERVSVRLRR